MSEAISEIVRAGADVREPTPGGSQGVDRTLDLIEFLASTGGASTSQIADALGVHRSIVYRMLKSLEARDFVRRDNGTYVLGIAFLAIANAVPDQLHEAPRAVVRDLSQSTGVTAYIVVDAGGRTVCLLAVEPEGPQPRVSLRPGAWGPMDRGAPAYAILSARPPRPGEPAEVTTARARGYATGRGPSVGVEWVASPIRGQRGPDACIGVLYPAGTVEQHEVAKLVTRAAATLDGL